jgi:hypothetical protein
LSAENGENCENLGENLGENAEIGGKMDENIDEMEEKREIDALNAEFQKCVF